MRSCLIAFFFRRSCRTEDDDGVIDRQWEWRWLFAMAYGSMRPPQTGLMGDHLTIMTSMPSLSSMQGSSEMAVTLDGRRGPKKEDRIPQWGYHETKEFIAIRAELEKDFTQTKRNKTLWELISGKMKEKSFRRSADQCKCKWKNLVNRYKVRYPTVLVACFHALREEIIGCACERVLVTALDFHFLCLSFNHFSETTVIRVVIKCS